jgi:hypothetical protein
VPGAVDSSLRLFDGLACDRKWGSVITYTSWGYRKSMSSSEARFVAEISEAKTPEAGWTSLDAFAADLVGHRLFTVTLTDMAAGLVRRAYSNQPVAYPTSGTKPLRGNTGEWFETVFNQRRTFTANTIEDIAKVFPDHELIASLGCGSVVNLPIILHGDLVATINLLAAPGHYTPERVAIVETQLRVPSMLCVSIAERSDALT